MDQYLLGLGEVPSSWPVEVLKAQAIAARSYALDKVNRLGTNRPSCSCSLYGTVDDQNYEGYDKEAAFAGDRWVAAVQGTAGVVATYNGAPIQAYYSSSSGGYTENSEDGFSAYLPYLRATPDPDDEVSPNFHWTQNYTTDELTSWFGAAADTAVGVVRRIELLEPFNASGRVGRVVDADHGGVRIVGSTGTKRVSGQRLQTVINRGVYAGGFGYARELRSNLFRVSGGGFDAYDPRFGGGVFVATGPVSGGTGIVVTGAGAGGGPHVRVLEESGVERAWFAYDPRFAGGVSVAACDLDGDGRSEIVTGAGPGGGPHVQVFRADGTPMAGWFAYPPTFVGGVYVACGDVDGDGQAEVVTGAGPGGVPLVAVFRPDGRPVNSFLAYDVRFGGGVRVAVGDLDGPGGQPPRIVTGAGRGGGAHIAVYRGDGGLVNHFFALPAPFASGVYVAVGDTNGDGTAEIIAGSGESGEPRVLVFDRNGTKLSDQLVGANSAALGARVAAGAPAGILGIVVGAGHVLVGKHERRHPLRLGKLQPCGVWIVAGDEHDFERASFGAAGIEQRGHVGATARDQHCDRGAGH